MNNNTMNFDPITGQPINQNNNIPNQNTTQEIPQGIQATPVVNLEQTATEQQLNNSINQPSIVVDTQKQMQNIPTIEQSKEEFIDNTQVNNSNKQDSKDSNANITFIIILFVIIFASIFFLFPYLNKIL